MTYLAGFLGVVIGSFWFFVMYLANFKRPAQTIAYTWTRPGMTRVVKVAIIHRARMLPRRNGRTVAAITYGRRIYTKYTEGQLPDSVLKHELVHVKQYIQHGWVKFLWLYGQQLWQYGYMDAPFEREARGQ